MRDALAGLGNVQAAYPLTSVQQAMLLATVLAPEARAYCDQFCFAVPANVDPALFERAWQRLLARHAVLRTSFLWQGLEEPVQLVAKTVDSHVGYVDLTALPGAQQAARLAEIRAADRAAGFEPGRAPLMRAQLVRTTDSLQLVWSYHHLLLDAWSAAKVMDEQLQLYRAEASGSPAALPSPRPFRDYVDWQRSQDFGAAEAFWRTRFGSVRSATPLPLDAAPGRALGGLSQFATTAHALSKPASEALAALARERRLTLNLLVQAAWALVLAHHASERTVVYGLTVAGRPPELKGVDSIIGCLINTLPVAVTVEPEAALWPWLRALQLEALELRRYEASPLPRVQALSGVPGGQALFESVLVANTFTHDRNYTSYQRTNFALALTITPRPEGLTLSFGHDLERFPRTAVRRLLGELAGILEALLVAGEGARVADLLALAVPERQRTLREWNDTARDWSAELAGAPALLHALFERQAERTPERIAVEDEGGCLSYAALDARAEALARRLAALGVGPESVVAIAAERSLALEVGLLAVLKAGAAYLPLDASYPAERLAFMLADVGAAALLVEPGLRASLPVPAELRCVELVEGGALAGPDRAGTRLATPVDPESPAYVIFTSGSTGRPKGAVNRHAGIVNRLLWMQEHFRLSEADRVLQKTPTSFDVSVWELFWPLLVGARLVMARPGGHKDPRYLVEALARHAVTTVHFVPSMLAAFLDGLEAAPQALPGLRAIVASGEALPAELAARAVRATGARVTNLYGPTEAAVDVTVWTFDPDRDRASVPIGRPIANTQVHVLSPRSTPLQAGAPGEIVLGGANLGRGYHRRPGLTAARFVPDPVGPAAGARLYRTGDLGRFRPDGALEFLGRLDFQVKVRGFRIELGEIEAALLRLPTVREAAVLAQPLRPGELALVAYLVPTEGASAPAALRAALAASLPEHMVPAAFVVLERLPLSPAGKLDRKALPLPRAEAREGAGGLGPVAEILAGLWAEVLGFEGAIGPEDSFFDLGGHSLLATRVAARLREAFGVELPLPVLLERATLAALAAEIEAARGTTPPGTGSLGRPLVRLPDEELRTAPLSFAQERMWFLAQLEPGSPLYNVPAVLDLEGELVPAALGTALTGLLTRHEVLRTRFVAEDGRPRPVLDPAESAPLTVVDLAGLPASAAEPLARALSARFARLPFDLARGPIVRFGLVRVAPRHHRLLLSLHHVAGDGWSLGVLASDFAALYTAHHEGRAAVLPALPVRYVDYAAWQAASFADGGLEAELEHWRRTLADAPAVLSLPTDRPRPPIQRYRGAIRGFRLEAPLTAGLRALARRTRATLFMTLLALFDALLARLSGSRDLLVGAPNAGRPRRELEPLVGFFVNTLVHRVRLPEDPSVLELVALARAASLDALGHAQLPFERLVAELAPERSLAHAPLFQVLLVLQNGPAPGAPGSVGGGAGLALPGLTLRLGQADAGVAKFDLVLAAAEAGDALQLSLEHDTDLFDGTTVERWGRALVRLAEAAVADPAVHLSALPLLAASERQQLLREWQGAPESGDGRALPVDLAAAAAARPDALALLFVAADGWPEHLSYGALWARAGHLAAAIRAHGPGSGESGLEARVGVCVERSNEAVVGLVAVLAAGAAYQPLDPAQPDERLAQMLADGGASLVLTQPWFDERFADWPGARLPLAMDPPSAGLPLPPIDPGAIDPGAIVPGQLAYLIFTSGSTGRPKGVLVPHRGLASLCRDLVTAYRLEPRHRHLTFNSLAFDAAASNVYPPLLVGATYVQHPDPSTLSPAELEAFCDRWRISHLDVPPAFWGPWLAELEARGERQLLPHLEQLNLGGDSATAERVASWARACRARIFGPYGPTEATVAATYEIAEAGRGVPPGVAKLPIGRPVPATGLFVVDAQDQVAAVGVVGEILLTGAGVARGYHGQPAATAERFRPDALSGAFGARLYRTGDLGRWLADGRVEFLGRRDGQLKVRGFRVELGEIEAALASHPAVAGVVVQPWPGPHAEPRLVAYHTSPALSEAELRSFLAERLPAYMVPSAFVALPELPLGATGKIDRRLLPPPPLAAAQVVEAPTTPLEGIIAAIYSELLGGRPVGRHAGFFDLGGHSLLAAQAVSRLREAIGVELPLAELFAHPSPAALATQLEARQALATGAELRPPLVRQPLAADEGAPLSFAQERLWFFDQLEPGNPYYNLHGALRLGGRLAVDALGRALARVVGRHEALRTRFERAGSHQQPVAHVEPTPRAVPLPLLDLAALPAAAREAQLRRQVDRATRRSFDLARGPLFAAALLRLGPDEHGLALVVHHIAADGWSVGLLIRELAAAYARELDPAAGSVGLPALPVQYADYARWQRSWLVGEVLAGELAFWRQELAGAPPVLALPTDRPRPSRPSFRGAQKRFAVPAALAEHLGVTVRRAGATLFMGLAATLAAWLGRLAGRTDVVVGTPVAGRSVRAVESLIGLFVNTLVLRTRLDEAPSFAALLAATRRRTLAAFAHQEVPFERLVEELAPERDLAHTPLFQVLFVMQNTPPGSGELPGLTLGRLPSSTGTVQFDLVVSFEESPRGLEGLLDYATDLFDATTVARWAGAFVRLLEQATAAPEGALASFDGLGAAERHQLLCEWSGRPAREAGGATTVAELVLAQAEQTPDAVALEAGDGANATEHVSYAALAVRARAIAAALERLALAPEQPVAVCVARSSEAVAAMLGAMLVGTPYVPLDPAYPPERLAQMLEASAVGALLTQGWFVGLELGALPRLPLAAFEHPPTTPLGPTLPVAPERLVYEIFTSGSTGGPKGVLVAHRGLTNLCLDLVDAYELRSGHRHLTFNSLAFDASASNVFPPLVCGATFVLHPDPATLGPTELEELCARLAISHLDVPPSFFAPWLAALTARDETALLPALEQLNLGGDSVPLERARAWARATAGPAGRRAVRLFHPYGPTETTVGSSYERTIDGHELPAGLTRLPIGRALAGTRLRVLDEMGRLAPIGREGEIAIGGVGVARGYLGNPRGTAERFVPDAFAQEPGARLYRTGDLGRFLADGRLEFLGRADQQVKVRGFRIELGEIEAALLRHPQLRGAAVVARPGAGGEARLVAFVVADPDAEAKPSAGELRAHLAASLPAYMLPSEWLALPALPLAPTGKVDRRALAQLEVGAEGVERLMGGPDGAGSAELPQGALETSLAAIFSELLGAAGVGRHDSFFELGGHSLLATQAVSRLREVLGVELPVRALFEAPSVAALAERLKSERATASPQPPLVAQPRTPTADGTVLLPVSFNQQRLWFLDRLEPGSARYNLPAAMRLEGPLVPAALARALAAVLARHEVLRTSLVTVDGEPYQAVRAAGSTPLPVLDLGALPAATREAALARLGRAENARPFDLARGPLLRARLVRLGAEVHALLLTLHHAAGDGWSLGVLVGELAAGYRAALNGTAPALPPLAVQYGDYAAWQRDWLHGEVLAAELAWWRAELDGAPTALALPTDRPRPALLTSRGAAVNTLLPAALTRALSGLARSHGATLFAVLLAAYQVLLARLAGQDEVLVGVGVANRGRVELEPLIGFFVNTLVMRGRLGGNPRFEDVLSATQEHALAVFAHQEMPFDKLLDELKLPRDLSRMPLVQVAFVLQNAPPPPSAMGELALAPLELGTQTAKWDLLFAVLETRGGLLVSAEHNTDLFDGATIERWLEQYRQLLEAFVAAPATRIRDVALFDRELAHALGRPLTELGQVAALAPTQRDLYLDARIDPTSTTYSLGLSLPLPADCDLERWQRAVDRVLAAEPMARVQLAAVRGEPFQVVLSQEAPPPCLQLAAPSLDEAVRTWVKVPYDLGREPLLRSFIVTLPDGAAVALLAVHHALADAFSGKVFFERCARLYRDPAAEPAAVPSFLARSGELLARTDRPSTLAFWRTRLTTTQSLAPLELERGVQQPQAERLELVGPGLERWRTLAARYEVSPATLARALFALTVDRLLGTGDAAGDLLVYEVLGGRGTDDRATFGCFFHQLPVLVPRAELAASASAPELVRWLAGYRRSLGEHQHLSVLEQRRLAPRGGLRLVLNVYNFSRLEGPAGPAELSVHDSFPADEAHLLVADLGERWRLTFHHDAAALPVGRWLERLDALVGQLLERPERSLGELTLVLPAERAQLRAWNATETPYEDAASLLPALARTAAARPEAIALAAGDEQLSYAAFERATGALARRLLSHGVRRGAVVALVLERSPALVIAAHAVLRAGAAYLPIEPTYPAERIAFLLADAEAPVVLTQERWRTSLPEETGAAIWCLDEVPATLGAPPNEVPPTLGASGDELAYVIYTSGSTGQPKGAMNTHAALANRLLWMQQAYALGPDDRVLQKTPYTFDVSVWELFWPFLAGARLELARPEGHKDPAYLAGLIRERQITTLHFVPSMLRTFLGEPSVGGCSSLRWTIASGEALTADSVERCHALLPGRLENLYGPTEAAIDVSRWSCPRGTESRGQVPIGTPIANLRWAIVDRTGRSQPLGVPGELMLAGAGLARGYLARPGLTAERFVPDPDSPVPGARRYRSGDLARFRPDGNVEYRGRIDHQVKVRGLRIELGEIEAALTEQDRVANAAVVVLGTSDEARLVAYVEPADGSTSAARGGLLDELRAALARRLPDALRPTTYVFLERLPLTSSGKVDRKALPAPERSRPELERAFTAPATELEKALAAIWRDLLGLPKVGIHDSFFDLGGQSLLLARVQSELDRRLGVELSMVELFEHPTLAELARHLESRQSGGKVPETLGSERQDAADARALKRQGALAARRRPVGAGS